MAMGRMVPSGVCRGLNGSVCNLTMLSTGRQWGKVSLIGIEDGRPTGRLPYRQEARISRSPCTTFYNKGHAPVEQKIYSLGRSDGKKRDSALRHLNMAQNRRARLSYHALQAMVADPPTDGTENLVADSDVVQSELLQGTTEWFDLRRNRITASSFGNALGFWNNRRGELWEEKIGIKEPFSGNPATIWGSSQEAAAIEKYKEITGNSVEHVGFKIYKAGDEYLSWLGASPDGLIECKVNGEGGLGILEVKCPHNKGRPELGSPWDSVPYYYMPQAQGLLEIFDRQIMDFYVWTVNGSAVFRIERDPEYWGVMFRIMSEFWWGNVVPARSALQRGKSVADIQVFRPLEGHPATEHILDMSRCLARKSGLIWRDRMGQVEKFW